ncbi:MAG: DarT ssDNA thymidine ADP-ribosyltransferase family protein [Flavobacteriaceae bacterium]|nr:DarT ssDNA thymidine ADP-ribosyltransferase family protein [Flavobacteriaceae bacterium]
MIFSFFGSLCALRYISPKSLGTSTVIAGVYLACKYSKTHLYGIEQAVNSIGTKTNCIAAFAGGLIGALHGESIIPQRWKRVQDYNYIDRVSKRLLEIHEDRRVEKIERPSNEKGIKSISEIEDDSFKVGDKVFLETLGEGKIKTINRQVTLDEDRYNLIFDVQFEIGQSCRFVRRLSLKHDYKKLQNEIGLKIDYKKFQDEIEKRAIEYLIHFTSTHNLSYILKDKKLMSVEKLKDSGRIKDVLINDEKRLEDLKNYINLSLSGPNTEMFRTKRRDYKNRSWCVLKIDPKHIYDRETMFSYYNAANTMKLQNGISGDLSQFKKLFKKELHTTNSYGTLKVMTRDFQLPPRYPTSVQAEILVKDCIPLRSILEVCFESKEKLAEAKTLMCSHDTSNFLIDNEIFSPNRNRL